MIQLEEKQFNVLLNFFYSQFFCEGLENAINLLRICLAVLIYRGEENGAKNKKCSQSIDH